MKKIVCMMLAIALVFSNVNVSYAKDYKLVEDTTVKADREFSFDDFSTNYYYARLSAKDKVLYNDIFLILNSYFTESTGSTKLKNGRETFYVCGNCLTKSKGYTMDDYVDMYNMVCYDNPQFFFAEPTLYTLKDGKTRYAFGVLKEFSTKKKLREGKNLLEKRLKDYINVINKDVKLKTANDLSYYIASRIYKNIPYDWVAALFDGNEVLASQSMYSALVNKKTVCAGYSKLYSALMNYYGIETISVLSDDHAWNMTRIDDEWYVTDLTQATGVGDFYLLLNAKQLKKYDKDMLDDKKLHIPTKFYASKIPAISTKKYKNTYQFVEDEPDYKLSWPTDSEVSVTITTDDNATIYYSIDNGPLQEYTGTLTFSNKESHYIIMTAKGKDTLRSHETLLHIGK